MKTTEGLKVAGLQKAFDVKSLRFSGWSGRVRVVVGDPFYDEYEKWDDQGKAINHKYGDINLQGK